MMNIYRYLAPHQAQRYFTALALTAYLCLNSVTTFAQDDALTDMSLPSSLTPHSFLLDLEQVGNKLVAVGERGHILISEDEAISWQQMQVPVRVTLTASYFINKKQGWVVGHDGVVLNTLDGGIHWHKQLDGEQVNQLMSEHAQSVLTNAEIAIKTVALEQRNQLEMELEELIIAAGDTARFLGEGASRPFIDVWFRNELEGFIIGAYGLFLHTTDGGRSWQPWTRHINNPDLLHLNAISPVDDSIYIAAEAGFLFRSDDNGENWISLESPYDGTFFGLIGAGDHALVAYGLRGNAFISFNKGDTWKTINTGIDASLFGSTRLADGSIVLVGDGGFSIQINPIGKVTHLKQTIRKLPLSAVINKIDNSLLSVGLGGIHPLPIHNNKS